MLTGYQGSIILEPMNWYCQDLSIQEILVYAYQKARQLDVMRNLNKSKIIYVKSKNGL